MSNIGFAGVTDFAMTSTATAVRVMGITGVGSSSETVQGTSLALNFVSAPTGYPVLDPRVTFSRTSNATVTGPDGLLGYAPHNLFTYSEQFDNAAWVKENCTITANSIVAPDGTTTADTLVRSGTGTSRFFAGAGINGLATSSVYARAGTQNFLVLQINTAVNAIASFITFNLIDGSVGTSTNIIGSLPLTATATAVGNGWYRCSVSCTAITDIAIRIGAANAANTRNGDDGATIYVWGAQLNIDGLQPYYTTTVKNLLGYTQEFDNAAWTKTRTTISANVAVDPQGFMTADKLVDDATASATHFISVAATRIGVNVISIYAKKAEHDFVRIASTNSTTSGAFFNLATGQLGTTGGTAFVSASIADVGNGWYRCSMTTTDTGTIFFGASPSDGTLSYTGNGTSGIFIWGAQLSDSASLDPYVYNPVAAPTPAAYYGPRFDYDPVTLAPKGLLIEEQRTNLLLQSGFAGAAPGTPGTAPTSWSLSPSGGAIDSVVTDLLGQNTVTLSATANRQALNQTITLAANTTYTLSTVVVANSGVAVNQLIAAVNPPAGATQSYTINGVTVVNPNVTAPIAGDRVAIILVVSATAGTMIVRLGVGVNGNVTGTVALKWPQVEAGAFATSYIPTTTAAATRAPDVATMIGANFSNWYNQNEGTLFVNAIEKPDTATRIFASITDGTTEGYAVATFSNTGRIRAQNISSSGIGTTITGQSFKIGYSFESGAQSGSLNGSAIVTIATTVTTVPTLMRIGCNQNATSFWNSHVSRIAYFPRRLSNTELQGITS